MSNTTAQPGGKLRYRVEITNIGDEDSTVPVAVNVALPAGLTVTEPNEATIGFFFPENQCTALDGSALAGGESELKCEVSEIVHTHRSEGGQFDTLELKFVAAVDPLATLGQTISPRFSVEGGGAEPVSAVDPVQITANPPGYGIDAFDGLAATESGDAFIRAGGHPASLRTDIDFNTHTDPAPIRGDAYPVEATRDVVVNLPEGFVGNPTITNTCTLGQLSNGVLLDMRPLCPASSQVGTVMVRFDGRASGKEANGFADSFGPVPLFDMAPPPGSPARFGFNVLGTPVLLDASLRPDYRLAIKSPKISQYIAANGATVTFWGVPSSPVHASERACPGESPPFEGGPSCDSGTPAKSFFRMPTSCSDGMHWDAHVDSWDHVARLDSRAEPDLSDPNWKSASYISHESPGYPASPADPTTPWGPQVGVEGCEDVPVKGKLSATPSSIDTETSSGLAVHIEIPNPGMDNPSGIASSDIKGVRLALPRGVTINPSQAEGLGVCSLAQYEETNLVFHPSEQKGCPSDSKIGTLKLKTPLLEDELEGQVFIAKQFDNPFHSLLAIYLVIESPQRGILIKLAGKVEPDETTGQIVTTFEDLPQLPFSSFDFKFREGARAPLVTPPTCGTYTTETVFTPWSDPAHKLTSLSAFQIVHGIGGGPCPPGGTPGFKPGFQAGSENNDAGSFSPFYMRLTRSDGEQDMTRFSAVLPPGVVGKLAGLAKCPDSAIAAAKAKTGLQERAAPSCPGSSEIGHTLVGAGVGSVLTYIPGKLYLGGPFHGDPLSVIAITPAVAGPFDVGTVVVHEALTLNPATAEVEVDGSASDPIPHILKGIPAKVRDLRVYVDKPDFTLNPTSCDPSTAKATLFGGGGNAFSTLDDLPVALSDRYQAANCANLGFKPRLDLRLRGGTGRGAFPGLKATYTPRKGDANVKGLIVRLSRAAFLEQGHIRTICTKVQFAAGNCPKAAQYGYIKAWTPLLDEPLQGPVWLRSSNHKLPDLVFDLRGLVNVEVSTRIDSFKGGIRATVQDVPDAPISRVQLEMQGGKKGLIVNSRDLCGHGASAGVQGTGQNGKQFSSSPPMRAQCGRARKHRRRQAPATG